MSQVVSINSQEDFSLIEQVVMQGDLSKLNAEQRVTYYRKVCESAGLNPFTRPFDYILLNGKLTLYAKKDATEQLRKINGISVYELDCRVIDDLYLVTAKARDKLGRTDESTGAVVIGHLKGEGKANAIMKAETKAKRRVTLSICGMGWVDETEIDTIPGAEKVSVDLSTGEMNSRKTSKKDNHDINVRISNEQAEELEMIFGDCDPEYTRLAKTHLKNTYNVHDFVDLPAHFYSQVKEAAMRNVQETYAKQQIHQVEAMA